jgi:hypothetical protein
MALEIRSSVTIPNPTGNVGHTVFQPVALSGVADELSVFVVLHRLDTAVQVQVVPLARSDGCGIRVQPEAAK